MKRTRREFMETAAWGAAGAGIAIAGMQPTSLFGAQATRSYTAGNFALEIDGVMAGWLQSAQGGNATGDVATEKAGATNVPRKHIGGVKYEDITLTCGAGMSRAFYEWIKATLDQRYQRKDGAIVSADYTYKELNRVNFYHALITEIGLPALDAASKDAAKMSIKITPETTRSENAQGAGRSIQGSSPGAQAQKKWMPANFRLSIQGMDTTRVNKIEAIVVKQKVMENQVGQLRTTTQEPAKLEVPNLVVTFAETSENSWTQWQKNFASRGKADATNQKSGQLDYLTPDMRQSLFSLQFVNLGLFKLTPEKVEARGDNIRRVKAEMYCEAIHFNYGNAAWA